MKRVLAVAIVCAALQVAARADGIDLANKFGSISISNAGIVSVGSQLRQYNAINNGHSLGSVAFATGALLTGSIMTGATFSDVGSFFKVTGVGNAGQPKGVIFNGVFVGPISWTLVSQNGVSLMFELTGQLSGTLYNGMMVTGTTTQFFHTTVAQLSKGIAHITSGNTHLNATPEPGTLALLATGLLGIAHVARRKLFVKPPA
jgi:hypothetical protein